MLGCQRHLDGNRWRSELLQTDSASAHSIRVASHIASISDDVDQRPQKKAFPFRGTPVVASSWIARLLLLGDFKTVLERLVIEDQFHLLFALLSCGGFFAVAAAEGHGNAGNFDFSAFLNRLA